MKRHNKKTTSITYVEQNMDEKSWYSEYREQTETGTSR